MEGLASLKKSGTAEPRRQLRLRRPDGKAIIAEATSMAIVITGEIAVQTILHDVTDQRLMEEQFRQAQKMEAVGRLAGGVAHDFNNLLTVIDAHAEFASRSDEPEETRMADIEEIRRASASAARLTRQLLVFSRKQAIAPAKIDLGGAIAGLLVMLNRLIGDDVRISTHLAQDLWPVHADASHIEQVLLNLALNARDAMPAGGSLTFQTMNTPVGSDYRTTTGEPIPKREYVLLTVEDTGTGMTQEIQSRVFEPFLHDQVCRSRDWTGAGNGLRNRQAVWRLHLAVFRGRARNDIQDSPAPVHGK
jgi:two-component system, cell cycle sensor histidine kinase and response regulator CckA